MKKINGALALFLLLFSVALFLVIGLVYYTQSNQPKNIFDEIQTVVQNRGAVYRQLNDVQVNSREVYDKDMNETGKHTVMIDYVKGFPSSYRNVKMESYESPSEGVFIRFEWRPNDDLIIWFSTHYNQKEKVLSKIITIIKAPRETEDYITDESKIREFLKQYNISSSDLDAHYNAIVNQKVLKDWCSIYDSVYSPEDYGQVAVKTQWEKW